MKKGLKHGHGKYNVCTTPQMIPQESAEWHGVSFSGLFLFFNFLMFIYFHHQNDELDKRKENIF